MAPSGPARRIQFPKTQGASALLVAAAATVAAPVWAVDWRAPPVVWRSCAGCRGIDGNSESPMMPRLAGQQSEYLENVMAAYRLAKGAQIDWIPFLSTEEKPGARTGPMARLAMIGPAHYTDETDTKSAIDWYSKQAPAAPRTAPPSEAISRGAKIYAEGIQDENVAACVTCHGPEAQGRGKYPRLAGQHAGYLTNQIHLLATGERQSTLMGPTAHALNKAEIDALVAYLTQL